jgi:hypothetical protein
LGEAAHDDLATKADLAVLKSEIAAVKAELNIAICGGRNGRGFSSSPSLSLRA